MVGHQTGLVSAFVLLFAVAFDLRLRPIRGRYPRAGVFSLGHHLALRVWRHVARQSYRFRRTVRTFCRAHR